MPRFFCTITFRTLVLVCFLSPLWAADFQVVSTDPQGFGFSDATPATAVGGNDGATLGQQRLNAVQYAADIWGDLIDSQYPFTIEVSFDGNLPCESGDATLASPHPIQAITRSGVWYPEALANALNGSDTFPDSSGDIVLRFNLNLDGSAGCLGGAQWYLGYDRNGGGDIDMVTVALHEIAHGLGIHTFANYSTGELLFGARDIFNTFLFDSTQNAAWPQLSNAQRLASMSNDGGLVWNGPLTVAAAAAYSGGVDGANRPEMYAPAQVVENESVVHLSDRINPADLLEPNYQGPNHNPGLALYMLYDMGWEPPLEADVSLELTTEPARFDVGQTTTVVLTVRNGGPGALDNLQVQVDVPESYSVVTSSAGAGVFNVVSGLWTLPLGNGANATLTLNLRADVSGYAPFQAEVVFSSRLDPDSTPGNGVTSEDDMLQRTFTAVQVLQNGQLITNIAGDREQWRLFRLPVPANQASLQIETFGGGGDADLYVRSLDLPTLDTFNERPAMDGNEERVSLSSPDSGDWYFGVFGNLDYFNANIFATFNSSGLRAEVTRVSSAGCPDILVEVAVANNQGTIGGLTANHFQLSEDGGPFFAPVTFNERGGGVYELGYTTTGLDAGDHFPSVTVTIDSDSAAGIGVFNNCTPQGGAANIWMSRDDLVLPDTQVIVPIRVQAIDRAYEVNSFELDLQYDPAFLDYQGLIIDGTVVSEWDLVFDNEPSDGQLRFNAASTREFVMDTSRDDVLLGMIFDVSDAVGGGACTELVIQRFVFNNETPIPVTTDGRLCVPSGGGPGAVADLSLRKLVDNAMPVEGETFKFQLTVFNGGPDATFGVTVRDQLPAGVTYVSHEGDGDYNPSTGEWSAGTIFSESRANLDLYAQIPLAGTYTNTAEVTASAFFDPDSTPNNGVVEEDDIASVVVQAQILGTNDLSVMISADNDAPAVGEDVVFQLRIDNAGPNDAVNTQVVDRLFNQSPSGMSYVTHFGTGDFDPGTGIWSLETIPAGEFRLLNLVLRLESTSAVTQVIEVLSTHRPDPDSTPNNQNEAEDDQDQVTVRTPAADLSLIKTADKLQASPGEIVTFLVQVNNEGPSDASNVAAVDLLPPGLEYVTHVSAASYEPESGVWRIDWLHSGGTATLQLQARKTTFERVTNTAEVITQNELDPDSTPNNHVLEEDDMDSVTIETPIADLSLSAVIDDESPAVGDLVNIDLTLKNDGPDTALDVAVLYEFLAFDLVGAQSWTVNQLFSGESTQISVSARRVSSQSDSPSFSAEVSASSAYDPDSTPANGNPNEDDIVNAVFGNADLALAYRETSVSTSDGQQISLVLDLDHEAGDPARDIRVRIIAPGDLPYISFSGDGAFDAATGFWDVAALVQGEQATATFSYTAVGIAPKSVTAEIISASVPDPDSVFDNNNPSEDDWSSATVTSSCNGRTPQIVILNGDGPGEGFNDGTPVSPVGGNSGTTLGAQRLIAFQRAADIWAAGLNSTVDLVIEARFDNLTCSSTSAILGSAGPKSVSRDFLGAPRDNTWYPVALANRLAGSDLNGAQAEVTATFNAAIDNNNGCLSNTNWYYGLDGNAGNNMDFVSVLLHELGHGLGFLTLVNANGQRFYGRDDIYMSYLQDNSNGLTWPQMSDGQRGASAVNTNNLVFNGPTVKEDSSFLTSGRTGNGEVEMFAPNPYQQGSSVSHWSTRLAPDELMEPYYTGPNHQPGLAFSLLSDLGWTCSGSPDVFSDLNLSMAVDNSAPGFGENFAVTVTVRNNGPDASSEQRVAVVRPSVAQFVSAAGDGSYDAGVWDVGALAVDESKAIVLTFNAAQTGAITFSAEVAAAANTDPDSTPGNGDFSEDDAARVQVNVSAARIADLSLAKTVDRVTAAVGDNLTYSVTVVNDGPDTAQGVTVRDQLPAGLTLISASSLSYDAGSGVWEIGTMNSGAIEELTLVTRLDSDQAVTNVAEVTASDAGDPDSAPDNGVETEDDWSSATVNAGGLQQADMSVTLASPTINPTTADEIELVIGLRNDGPREAGNLAVQILLPAFLEYGSAPSAYDPDSGLWSLQRLAAGASTSLTLIVVPTSVGTGQVTADLARSNIDDPDSVPGNLDPEEDDYAFLRISIGNGPVGCSDCLRFDMAVEDPAGYGFNDETATDPVGGNNGTTLGEQRRIAFEHAAALFCQYYQSPVPVRLVTRYSDLTCDQDEARLAVTRVLHWAKDFPNAPRANTWYPSPLADALTGVEQNPDVYDVSMVFNNLPDAAFTAAFQEESCIDSQMNYVVENRGRRVKYEGAATGLGEDRTWMRDFFEIDVSGGGLSVDVTLKAARTTRTVTLVGAGDSAMVPSMGFRVKLLAVNGNRYSFQVTAECNFHALSHVEFDFGGAANVTSPTQNTSVDRQTCEGRWSPECGDGSDGSDGGTGSDGGDGGDGGGGSTGSDGGTGTDGGDGGDGSDGGDGEVVDPSPCLAGARYYYGLDGQAGGDVDFVTIVLRELIRGLGLSTAVDLNPGSNAQGERLQDTDDIFMTFLRDGSTTLDWTDMSDSQRYDSARDVDDLFWTGMLATDAAADLGNAVNNDGLLRLFASDPVLTDRTVVSLHPDITPRQLMLPYYRGVKHQLGLANSMLLDLGWPRRGCIDLNLSMSVVNPDPQNPDRANFTLSLTNEGAFDASGVQVRLYPDSGLTFFATVGNGDYESSSRLWRVGDVPAGETRDLVLTFEKGQGSKLMRAEVVTANEVDVDSVPANLNPREDDYAQLSLDTVDLNLNKFASASTVEIDQLVTFTLQLNNEGSDDAGNVVVRDLLPAGLLYVSHQGEGRYEVGSGEWDIGAVPAGDTMTLEIITRAVTLGTWTNRAEVIAVDEPDSDSTPDNGNAAEDDDAQVSVTVVEPAPPGPSSVTVFGVQLVTCPTMRVKLRVERDGVGLCCLTQQQFSLSEDGREVAFTLINGPRQGEYWLEFEAVTPDGMQHVLDLTVSLNDAEPEIIHAVANFTTCETEVCTELENEQVVSHLSGFPNSWRCFFILVPPGQRILTVDTFLGDGDADLYVKYGAPPSLTDYDYRPDMAGNDETVAVDYPRGGTWWIGVHGFDEYLETNLRAAYANSVLTATIDGIFTDACPEITTIVTVRRDGQPAYALPASAFRLSEDGVARSFDFRAGDLPGQYILTHTTDVVDGGTHQLSVSVSSLGSSAFTSSRYSNCRNTNCVDLANNVIVPDVSGLRRGFRCFRIDVPEGQDWLETRIWGGSGDADLYLKFGEPAGLTTFDQRLATYGNDETIRVRTPQAGAYYLGVHAFESYTGLNVLARYYSLQLGVEIEDVTVAECPTIGLTVRATADGSGLTGLSAASFQISENGLDPILPSEANDLGGGRYFLKFDTRFFLGQSVAFTLTLTHENKVAVDDDSFDNCTRYGAALDVWINEDHGGPAGGVVTIPIWVEGIEAVYNITSFQARVEYDAGLLTYQGFSTTDSLIDGWEIIDDSASTSGRVNLVATNAQQLSLIGTGEKVLINLEFAIDDFAVIGTCTDLDLVEGFFQFNNGTPHAVLADGRFCVTAGCFAAIGDVDGDGNAKEAFDALQVLRYMTGIPTPYDPIPICVADTNCNGEIATIDAVNILRRGVGLLNAYCGGGVAGTRSTPSTFEITLGQGDEVIQIDPGTRFEIPLSLTLLPQDDTYGYTFELTYDPSVIDFTEQPEREGTLTERWGDAIVNNQPGRYRVTHVNPISPIDATGVLVRLQGRALQNEGTSQVTFVSFQLAEDSEPTLAFGPYTIEVSNNLCYSETTYWDLVENWGGRVITILDILNLTSCVDNP